MHGHSFPLTEPISEGPHGTGPGSDPDCPWKIDDTTVKLDDRRCVMPGSTEWLLCADVAFSEFVLVLILLRLVIFKYDKKSYLNKLSLLPLYFLILSVTFALLQYYYCLYKGKPNQIALFLNMNKTYFMYSGIAIQTFEWYDTYKMINFQDDYSITDAHIEKRKFQPAERSRAKWFFSLLAFYYFIPLGVEVYLIVSYEQHK